VEFNPSALPQGWVKEMVYRKTREGIRKDPVYIKNEKKIPLFITKFCLHLLIIIIVQYYTDPVSQYVFRTLKAACSFLATGKVTKRQFIQRTSVHDLYSFEKSADLVIEPPFYVYTSNYSYDITSF
jgi:hypothetical protein